MSQFLIKIKNMHHSYFSFLLLVAANNFLQSAKSATVDPVNVLFRLLTPFNPTTPQILKLGDVNLLQQSNFSPFLPTKICADGWTGNAANFYGIAAEYLKQGNCNVIIVDWATLSNGDYNYVAENGVPIAGATTGEFINFLIDNTEMSLNLFHLVGFSMGAHLMGYAGNAVTSGKPARITGLDPAAWGFPLESPDLRLDTSDAEFVDVIHCALSYSESIGHCDSYPNGGFEQPGCSDGSCGHARTLQLFNESINSPIGFKSYSCSSYNDFQSGACNGNQMAYMGDGTETSTRGVFYLNTNAVSPYAQE